MSDTFYIGLDVRCEGRYVPAIPSRFCHSFGNWLPGECSHIVDFQVFLGDLEITNHLSKKELSELESDYLISIESGEEVA